MITVDRYQKGDRALVEALFREFYGEGAAPYIERFAWQYEANPNAPGGTPLIWLVRLDGKVIGQYATMPVRLMANGTEIDAAWGTDVLILPGHQRLGIGRKMFDAWDQGTGASIGLGLTDASHGLFKKLAWPDMGRVPRLIKRLSARKQEALSATPPLAQRIKYAVRRRKTLSSPVSGDIRRVERFDGGVTELWERVGRDFAFAVRRDAPYLNWKFADSPTLNYEMAVLEHDGITQGYAIIRHFEQDGWRVTVLVDFLADQRPSTFPALLHWVDCQAMRANSDVIRVSSRHGYFNATMRSAGYEALSPSIRFVAKINAVPVPDDYYTSLDSWHVTVGDSDNDR